MASGACRGSGPRSFLVMLDGAAQTFDGRVPETFLFVRLESAPRLNGESFAV